MICLWGDEQINLFGCLSSFEGCGKQTGDEERVGREAGKTRPSFSLMYRQACKAFCEFDLARVVFCILDSGDFEMLLE